VNLDPTALAAGALAVLLAARLRIRPRPRPVDPAAAGTRPAEHPVGSRRSAAHQVGHLRRRPPVAAPEQVASWCDGLARAVAGGSTVAAAIRDVEVPPACDTAVEQIRLALGRGAPLAEAVTITPGSPHLQLALTVLHSCAVHGGQAAEPLSRAAAVLRERAADAAELRTQSAQARLSAIVMTALPVGMLALMLVTSRAVRGFVVSPVGIGVVAVGLGLNAIGWRWMTRLVGGGAT
jgi:tight adherence protein B